MAGGRRMLAALLIALIAALPAVGQPGLWTPEGRAEPRSVEPMVHPVTGQAGVWMTVEDFDWALEQAEGHDVARQKLIECQADKKQDRQVAEELRRGWQSEQCKSRLLGGLAVGAGVALLIETIVLVVRAMKH